MRVIPREGVGMLGTQSQAHLIELNVLFYWDHKATAWGTS